MIAVSGRVSSAMYTASGSVCGAGLTDGTGHGQVVLLPELQKVLLVLAADHGVRLACVLERLQRGDGGSAGIHPDAGLNIPSLESDQELWAAQGFVPQRADLATATDLQYLDAAVARLGPQR